MYFTTFPVATTNIFPQSNSKYGGQLMSEWNLRCREMVSTSPDIQYDSGLSFVHSYRDFEVSAEAGTANLVIAPGRGIVNGHFVETLAPMVIDLMEANMKLKLDASAPLKGSLEVGIRVFYSTESTMAGTMLVVDKDNNDEDTMMFIGVQMVVLPKLTLPEESPDDINKVTAHIRLARFVFLNNSISGIENLNDEKCKYMSASRIKDIDMMLSGSYISKTRLNPNHLYVFAGKGTDPNTGEDTWCQATDSLMIWDNKPELTDKEPSEKSAKFMVDAVDQNVKLVVPHKQVEGSSKYYQSVALPVPKASYEDGTPGVVDKSYTDRIKYIKDKLNEFHQIAKGKQVFYMDVKNADTALPTINKDKWGVGDYVLVNQDFTVQTVENTSRAPSTLYVIVPGEVQSAKFHSQVVVTYTVDLNGNVISGSKEDKIPESLTGTELRKIDYYESARADLPGQSQDDIIEMFGLPDSFIRGTVNEDYFLAKYIYQTKNNYASDGETVVSTTYKYVNYYYVVDSAKDKQYSDAVMLHGNIPLAEEELIGGFLNVSTDAIDQGYIYRDDNGHLRLVDYGLLRSGVLAYQLGEDFTSSSNSTTAEIQSELDEYVNRRVAFPNATQMHNKSTDARVININITLPKEEESSEINIYDVDSRFNTCICINIYGEADSNTTVNITNCQKVKINNFIQGTPIINVRKSTLYYDAYVIDYIRQCIRDDISFFGFEDIKLWYEKFNDTDPNLIVNDMTVSELDAPIVSEDVDYWSMVARNDNHYRYALKSITFSGTCEIIRCEMLIGNDSTNNIDVGHSIVVSNFELPQGQGLTYPKSALTRVIKVTGTFVSAYKAQDQWVLTDTNFTAQTTTYDKYVDDNTATGSIAFHANTNLIPSEIEEIPGWDTQSYHLFSGGVIS